MALPVLPADGDNPWGAELRTALTDISNRADTGISNAAIAQSQVDSNTTQLTTNTSTLATHTSQISSLQTSDAAKALDSAVVKLTGNQTIAGTKTFSAAPIVPDSSFAISAVTGLQTAINAKAPLDSPTFTGTVGGISQAMVGLANVNNTTDAGKPISTATQTALDLKASSTDLTSAIQTHNHTGGTNGVNLPISAVTGLQTQINTFNTNINGKQVGLRVSTAGVSAVTMNTAMWSQQTVWLYRFGPIAHIVLHITAKGTISGGPTGNIANTTICTINSGSEFSHIYAGPSAGTMTYHLGTTDTGIDSAAYIDDSGTIVLSAVGSSQDIVAGYQFALSGMFLLDNQTG